MNVDRCFSVRELAKRWRTSPRRVRDMIRRRLVPAIQLPGCRGVRVTPESVAEAERQMAVQSPPRRRKADGIDPEIAAILDAA